MGETSYPMAEDGTVLVVEDESELADVFAGWIEERYGTRTAYTGSQALDALDESVGVVLLDRRLPDMTGDEVLDEIRDRDLDCRVAFITAVDPDFDILEMPCDDYIVKPIFKSELLNVVERMFERAELDERVRESFALASKLSALRSEKPRSELERSDEYEEGKERLEALRSEIDTALSEFDVEDFAGAYRDLTDTN